MSEDSQTSTHLVRVNNQSEGIQRSKEFVKFAVTAKFLWQNQISSQTRTCLLGPQRARGLHAALDERRPGKKVAGEVVSFAGAVIGVEAQAEELQLQGRD
jgi:hypothetical protein